MLWELCQHRFTPEPHNAGYPHALQHEALEMCMWMAYTSVPSEASEGTPPNRPFERGRSQLPGLMNCSPLFGRKTESLHHDSGWPGSALFSRLSCRLYPVCFTHYIEVLRRAFKLFVNARNQRQMHQRTYPKYNGFHMCAWLDTPSRGNDMSINEKFCTIKESQREICRFLPSISAFDWWRMTNFPHQKRVFTA